MCRINVIVRQPKCKIFVVSETTLFETKHFVSQGKSEVVIRLWKRIIILNCDSAFVEYNSDKMGVCSNLLIPLNLLYGKYFRIIQSSGLGGGFAPRQLRC